MSFAPAPIPETTGLSLGLAFLEVNLDNTGKVASKRYWNHASEVFEPGPRDDAKHILPYQRLGDDESDAEYKTQLAFIPEKVLGTPKAIVVGFSLDASGVAKEVFVSYPRLYAMIASGSTW